MNYKTITREHAIELLLAKVEEVFDNGDWPTEDKDIQDLIDNIRKGD
jgi:hypothetical protein